MVCRLFVGATRQNDGKTMVSMGLYRAFQKRFGSISYIKPVGQQYQVVNGEKIDKDTILFQTVYDIEDPLKAMSPVAVPRGFTEDYIQNPSLDQLTTDIQNGFDIVSREKEFVLIEGTGHAGVGSVFDLSNGRVARLLNSKVVLVIPGGIGNAIDELMLNKACYDQQGVDVIGVVVNKVRKDKYDKVTQLLSKRLPELGLSLLGVIPFVPMLSRPSVRELQEGLNARVLYGEAYLNNKAGTVLIGAMAAHDAIDYFGEETLLIVPGNREGIIMTALFGMLIESKTNFSISGIVFTGGIQPNPKVLTLLEHTKVPVLFLEEDSYTVATQINRMIVKLRSDETKKISKIQSLVEEHVDVDFICDRVAS